MTSLHNLGQRICVMGPSNSGKSTLANAIGVRQRLPVVHLDVLFHEPHTDWKPRQDAEFLSLHHQAIEKDCWVMEGNYTRCITQRLARATGIILLDVSTVTSLIRYFRRTWFEHDRLGALEGGVDSIKWQMIRHIAISTPPNRRKYAEIFESINLPKLKLVTADAINHFYQVEGLGS
ncbi:ATPase AAA [uncultured Pseudomonas sp.]|uniref:ATPase AAA n=1 Tax=uncultured Pseudomonas sp. TaxID=114707 RepID=UPI0004981551|nr:ATPase AAA [uncultured Pseudomonas sp.]